MALDIEVDRPPTGQAVHWWELEENWQKIKEAIEALQAGGPAAPGSALNIPGLDGVDGEDGAEGPPGAQGAQGTSGTPGLDGSPGSVGPPGVDGQDGEDAPIIPGQQGPQGAQGIQGNPGAPGTNGIDGMPGFDGADGEDGWMGPQGAQGPQGPAGGGGGGGAGATAIVNFGSFPGTLHTTLVVTGQANIVAESRINVWMNPIASADHSADEHKLEQIRLTHSTIVPGTGFTIEAFYAGEHPVVDNQRRNREAPNSNRPGAYGQFNVLWEGNWT